MPAKLAVTFTENAHEALVATVPPERVMVCDLDAAKIAPLPQVPFRPLGVETARPAGKLSLNARPVSATAEFGFTIVKLREVEAPSAIEDAPNTSLIDGGL